MAWFTTQLSACSDIPIDANVMWDLLRDAETLAELTPLVANIKAETPNWRWTLIAFNVGGTTYQPSFVEHMKFDNEERTITFRPANEHTEKVAVQGNYQLEGHDNGCHVHINLEASIDLPFPRFMATTVERTMALTMKTAGQRFATNLYKHLGLDPNDATVRLKANNVS